MKKSLVLATAMALGVTASAYASNPFSDVPAGHWAYDSISKLAAAGVIEGYGDDTFRGDRLMTRYEMAQIVARAMAKGANVDKLAAEFADELDSLGVRISALEKKSDNVRITGEIRYNWARSSNPNHLNGGRREHGLRSRLYFNGKINDNWNYVGRIENQQWFHDDVGNEAGAGNFGFNVAKVEGRIGGVKVIAGRDDDVFADGYIFDGAHDALKLSYGDKWYINGAYGKLTDFNDNTPWGGDSNKFYALEVGSQIDGLVNGKIGYLQANADQATKQAWNISNVGIWYAGVNFNFNDTVALDAMYLRSNKGRVAGLDLDKSGFVVGLGYKGADEAEPGTWGLSAKYYNQASTTYLPGCHTIDGFTDWRSGFKGWSFGGDVTLAKNMVLGVTYYETKAKNGAIDGNNTKTKTLWTELNLTF